MRKKSSAKKRTAKRTGKVVIDFEAEQRKCYAKADALLDFMDGKPTGDFITDALVDAIDQAGEMVGFPAPTHAPEETRAERRRMLADLFSQDSDIRLRNGKEKVLRATLEILHNPKTPADLYEKVAEFVCDSMNETQQHGRPMIAVLLDSYPDSERRGAVIAAREEV